MSALDSGNSLIKGKAPCPNDKNLTPVDKFMDGLFRSGVLKLFNQGAGTRMQWQAVICGCLVPPPTPSGGERGGSVNTRGRIEDPGGCIRPTGCSLRTSDVEPHTYYTGGAWEGELEQEAI